METAKFLVNFIIVYTTILQQECMAARRFELSATATCLNSRLPINSLSACLSLCVCPFAVCLSTSLQRISIIISAALVATTSTERTSLLVLATTDTDTSLCLTLSYRAFRIKEPKYFFSSLNEMGSNLFAFSQAVNQINA